MFIKQLDFISPRVTFYYKGDLSHTSIVSGILSIISILLIIIYAFVYYIFYILKKEDPNSSYFYSFVEDAPIFKINTSSLFHFINIAQTSFSTIYEGIDFTTFRIIGVQRFYESYLRNNSLKIIPHWLYGYCENGTDTEGISGLITYTFFGKTACIKKYFDTTDQKYYDKGDSKFIYPEIGYGPFHDNLTIYSIIVERCKEDTIGYILGDGFHCRNDSQMEEYYINTKKARLFHFNFLNNYINVLDYKNPTKKFIYRIETPFYTNQFTVNNINFNPNQANTHNGLNF